MRIDEWSYKVSDGWPDDSEADVAGTAWAGVLPIRRSHPQAVPAPDLRADIAVPQSVRGLLTDL
jgi:hypothetical protein